MMGDAFSYLWSSVELAIARGAGVLMVTSARAAEGKSTVAANLCLLAAQQGKNTILIDGDIRHPTIHKLLGLPASPGLTNIVARETMYTSFEPPVEVASTAGNGEEAQDAGEHVQNTRVDLVPWSWAVHASLRQTLQQHPTVNKLKILTAGDAFIEPHRLWGAPIIEQIISILKQAADFVVIDSTPVIGIPDTNYIARYADQILFCVETARTETKLLQRALKVLDHTHAELLGVVMTKVDPTVLYGGYEYYRQYEKHSNKQGAAKRRSRKERSDNGGDFSSRL